MRLFLPHCKESTLNALAVSNALAFAESVEPYMSGNVRRDKGRPSRSPSKASIVMRALAGLTIGS